MGKAFVHRLRQLSLYKLLKREHAFKHIVRSGIEVEGKVITFEDEASVKKLQQKLIEELEKKRCLFR